MSRLSLQLAAGLDNLDTLVLFVLEHALRAGLDNKQSHRVELVMEEAAVNVIQHAYGGESGPLDVCCTLTPQGLQISLADQGPPFNPLDAPAVDLSADLTSRKIGGLGIHFMRNLADELDYRREGEQNLLILHFLRHALEGS